MAINREKIAKVVTALDNTYEKKVNKKTSIGADPGANDYPTSVAVKNFVEGKGYIDSHQDISGKEDISNKVKSTTGWSGTTSDNRYPSEKLVKDSLDNKLDSSTASSTYATKSEVPTKVSDLTNDSGYLTQHQSLDNYIEKASNATGLLRDDGTVDTSTYLTQHQSLSNYVTTDDSRLSDARTPTSHTHGDITNDGKLGTESGKIVTTGTGGKLQASASITTSMISDFPTDITPSSHTQASSTITDTNTYSNIGNLSGTQESINSAIDSKIGALLSVDLIEVTTNKGTASASTMNKLYLVAESSSETNDNYEIFVTVRTGTSGNYSYAWEKVDTARIDLSGYVQSSSLKSVATSGSYADLTNKPSFTPTVTSSDTGAYKIGSINISGSSVDIYGVDSGTSTLDIDSEINQALDDLAEAIYPTSNGS